MGNTTRSPADPPLLQVLVSAGLAQRVWQAAKRIDQPVAGWVRMAIVEKLDRDGKQSDLGS